MASLHKLNPRSRRLTAAECEQRLEMSALYQRRSIQARQAATEAKSAALWYLGADYRERLLPMKEAR